MSQGCVCIKDFQNLALAKLDKNARDYYESGADDEETLRDNIAAFSRYKLRPRFMRDVSNVSLQTTILGVQVSSPIGIAPAAMQKLCHPVGEVGTAEAAARTNSLMILSTYSTCPLEDVISASSMVGKGVPGNGMFWFQLYMYQNREVSEYVIKRAERAGYKALVLTIDAPVLGRRREDLRNKFYLPPHLSLGNFDPSLGIQPQSVKNGQQLAQAAINALGGGGSSTDNILTRPKEDSMIKAMVGNTSDKGMTWEKDIPWLRSVTKMKIVVKGLLTAEDAELACKWGVDGIIVSNHGGRQLDTSPSTLDSLPEIIHAVQTSSSSAKTKPEVYMDGGVRRGTDVLKALALGAKAVFIGRPMLWGLTVDGAEGVKKVLELLNEEVRVGMTLLGVQKVGELEGGEYVRHERYYGVGVRGGSKL
ncbi:Hydroxyacid oxidase 1 [Chytridiales sp. JEL 0842]|nr:Hydroxyacid oxidase 1 [Chytridiales sp. JEL 0842]